MTNENPRGLPVVRWHATGDYEYCAEAAEDGEFVEYEDYAALLAELDALREKLREANDALAEYANPDNWCLFEGKARLWFEPDTNTPDAYAGYELASKAQAAISAMEGES